MFILRTKGIMRAKWILDRMKYPENIFDVETIDVSRYLELYFL